MGEPVKWRQDKAPHLEGAFLAVVLHGESQSESAGPSRGTFAADPCNVIAPADVAEIARLRVGDTLTLKDGRTLSVQQVTKDATMGWTIRATTNEGVPK